MIDPVRRIPEVISEVFSVQKQNAETFRLFSLYTSYKMHDKW